ncbi:hypothetical protein K470DRAFT_238386 [Piedraia hortae CBS 480.64]|uniref:Uncharacterized protein n=1 Tax=Piedraia hortae CBS 480.64 TaxID=1314780 RepID=A0A6A7BRY1_9PEZI|nr:hypothetical protein K470DRAFT_238386 [Piedraia hortae CBS 480.64]
MFVARNNENAIYEQQTAIAAKGGLELAPKTPGKSLKTDENAKTLAGKVGGKNDFKTPAQTRTRAPLGVKTTNAKMTAFATPAPEKGNFQRSSISPRLRRPRVKPQAVADPLGADENVPEVEYMAPRGIPLPDEPQEWPRDRKYPQFEGKNLTRGIFDRDSAGEDEELSDFEEKLRAIDARRKKSVATKAKPVGTVVAKRAASSLANVESKLINRGPSFAAPTAATKSRFLAGVKKDAPINDARTANARHVVAKAASNTTLGYSKGRAIRGATRPSTRNNSVSSIGKENISPARRDDLIGGSSTLDNLFNLGPVNEADEDELFGTTADSGEDYMADFQLSTGNGAL